MKNKCNILTLCLFIIVQVFALNLTLKAVTAYPYPIEFTQPDGSKITILLKGDEKVKWALTTDGYSLMFNQTGTYEYATLDAKGNMVPSGIKANNVASRTAEELDFINKTIKGLFYTKEQIHVMKQLWDINTKEASKGFPTIGSRKLICILMNFTDVTFTFTAAEFNNMFNQTTPTYTNNGALGSVKAFFLENSYNQLTLTTDVFGPYTAANNRAYYGANDVDGNDVNPRALITEAVNAANAAANYADYDNDGDGNVDGVYVIYAGTGEADGGIANTIWPHASSIVPVTLDGKTISKYSCSNELRSGGTSITRIGVICHEFGHVLGAPDFYDTDYTTGGQYTGTGDWDLQANGSYNGPTGTGERPAHSNPYTKCYVYNWSTPILLTSNTSLSIPNSTINNVYYRYNTTTPGEFWLIENRQQTGFNTNVPYHGMIIYHADMNYINVHDYNLNAGSHQGMYPVCAGAAGNPPTVYGTINGTTCPFPGTGAKTSFTDVTTPNSKSWSGANTGYPITNIVEAGGVITACFIACPSATDPTSFAATASSTSQIDLSWTKNVSSNPVMVAFNTTPTFGTPVGGTPYVAGNPITGGGTVIYNGTNTTFNHTGRNPGTTYYYKAWSVIPTNTYSTGVINNATTLCGSVTTFPWNEGFENGGNIPNCWSQQYIADAWNWKFRTGSASGTPAAAHGGTYNANFYEGAAGTVYETKLITPSLALGTYASATLTFWLYNAVNTGQDVLNVYYRTSSTGSWNFLSTYSTSVAAWTQQTINLPYLSSDYYIAFDAVENFGRGVTIDDVQVTVTAVSSPPVINFSAVSLNPSVGETDQFKDLSSNVPTSWLWTFNPSTVSYVNATTSTSKNPQVTFNNAGTYDVTLKASNAFGTNTSTKTAYISTCSSGNINATGTWVEQATAFPTASRYPGYISIVNENIVWATGRDGSGGGASVREFTKTVNGGVTWTYGGTFNGISANMTDASMIFGIDANVAYAPFFGSTTAPMVGKTIDGGANWTANCTFAGATSFPNVVGFFDANNGFCMGDPIGAPLDFEIYYTSNAGGSWTRVPAANIPNAVTGEYGIVGLFDIVGNTAWFTTNNGYVYKSIDKGVNWTKHQIINTALTTNIYIQMSSANVGIAQVNLSDAAQNSMGSVYYKTIDAGVTWVPLERSGVIYDGDIAFVPGTCDSYVNTGADWSIANGMGISYSIDGGSTYANLNAPQSGGSNVQLLTPAFYNSTVGWAGSFSESATVGGIYKYYIPQPPVADFSANSTQIAVGSSVNFTDMTTNVPTAWNWTFAGGTPATSSSQNPTVTYSTAGTYSVTLTASNAMGSNTMTKTSYITVSPLIVLWNFTDNNATADGGIPANLSKNISTVGGTSAITYAGNAFAGNWSNGMDTKWWEIEFSTLSYQSLKLSSKMTANNFTTAPRDFKVQYKIGAGGTWTDVPGSSIVLSIENWSSPLSTLNNIALPAACDNQASVYLKWMVASNFNVGGGTGIAAQAGRGCYIDDIIIVGSTASLAGDVNGDGLRNVLDVVWLVSHVNGSTPGGFVLANADVNADASVNIADVAALINLIMGGAKAGNANTSDPAHLYLEQDGNVAFDSDGSLLALQFKLNGQQISQSNIDLLLGNNYSLAYNEQTGNGIIYSMSNTNIPAGRTNLIKLNGVNVNNLSWVFAEAANVNFNTVPVITHLENTVTNVLENNMDRKISISPNPNNGNFNVKIQLASKELLQFELLDEKGKIISQSERSEFAHGTHEYKNNNNGLATGLYIFRLSSFDSQGRLKEILLEEKIMIVK